MKDDDDDIIEYLIFDKTMRENKTSAGKKSSGGCLSGCLTAILSALAAAIAIIAMILFL